MSPDAKATRLDLVADEIDGARRLVMAGRMALDKAHAADRTAEEADAVCELLTRSPTD